MVTEIISAGLIVAGYAAVRHVVKGCSGCRGCQGNCPGCHGCPQKSMKNR